MFTEHDVGDVFPFDEGDGGLSGFFVDSIHDDSAKHLREISVEPRDAMIKDRCPIRRVDEQRVTASTEFL